MSAPLVSVVIPAYLAEDFIEFTMRSVSAQTHRPMELVVVDDCSPDRTAAIAKRIADEIAEPGFTIRVEHHDENRGGAAALKTGFAVAAGEYVCWLSADDAFIDSEKTRRQVELMQDPGVGLVYDWASCIGSTPETADEVPHRWAGNRRVPAPDPLYLKRASWRLLALFFGNPVNGSSVMIRRSVIESLGTFDPALRNVDQDSDLWMRLCALGIRFERARQAGVFYRIHPGQTSNLTDEVLRGCTVTRIRVLKALADSGQLGTVLDRSWPVLLMTRPGLFTTRPLVTQALCRLAEQSRCGVLPRLLLLGLEREFVRRGMWDESGLAVALAHAGESSRSDEFQRFVMLLKARVTA